ncbi:winged helix-turn-helix domain-containing protein [Polymorphobacter fuscus]|uniref:OmpR/PhoB-type domain-containing protein n=1 Tax=Sandarakinorhabdus fusca TaxID=1439888 RepID=A0A7C9GRS4_9SPHN|nr:winged helix-turn-helix domain-containing protein [Polymorphobacter fuscus]KAB7643913.1 hypothetical protein F9290_15290 [Polymorphobacter fuscus]MQT18616.1 hypothetical protein [Polymorphobacter fuscus]NJC07017.1 DNA-binding SARP family transcriptional activator [Polymorphobacter fuscus]
MTTEAFARPAVQKIFGLADLFLPDGTHVKLGKRARALMAMLAVSPAQSLSRDYIIQMLWGRSYREQGQISLRQCLSELRRELPETMLAADNRAIWLNPGKVQTEIDVLVAQSSNDDFVAGLSRLGRPFDSLFLPGAFEQWSADAGRSLTDRLRIEVHRRLSRQRAASQWEAVNRLAAAWLLREPSDSEANAALVLSQTEQGQTANARSTYDAFAGPASQPAIMLHPSAAPLLVVRAVREDVPLGLGLAIREEFAEGLSRFRELRIALPAAGAGEPRGPGYTLDCTVRGSQTPYLSARLATKDVGEVLWTDRQALDHDGASPRALQQQIADLVARVVATLVPTIADDAIMRPEPPVGPTYIAYLRARSLSIAPASHEAALASARALQQLISNDPDFIPAYAPLARLLNTDYFYTRLGSTGPGHRAQAQTLSNVAYASDSKDAHVNSLMGWCALRRQAWDEAERHFNEVVWLNPLNFDRLNEAGDGLVYLGEIDRGERLIESARALRGRFDAYYWNDIGKVRLFRGELDSACDAFEAGGDSLIWTPVYAAIAFALAGRNPASMRERALARLKICWPDREAMTVDRILTFFHFHHPFRLKEPQQLMESGLRQAFAGKLA